MTDTVFAAVPGPSPVVDAGSLLHGLRDGVPRTRAELSRAIGMSRSTITGWIDQLMDAGLVAPFGDAASTGGRPSSQFAFRPGAYVVLAADLGASHIRLAVTDLAGGVLAEQREEIDIATGPEVVLAALERIGGELLHEAGRGHADLVGVGIGVPGPVEFATGQPVNPPIMPGWDRFDIKAHVASAFDVPVVVDNDVNVMALGERTIAWPEVEDLLFVKVATGIGAGIIAGGDLRRGASGAAGDIGHAPLSRRSDVLCACGNRGCLEAVASGRAIAAELRHHGIGATGSREVVELVKSANVDAIQAVRQAGRDIGEILTLCVTLLNPAVIVIGGSMAQVAEHLVAGVREVVYARSIPLSTEHLTIAPARTSDDAAIAGASRLATDAALSPSRLGALLMRR
ncbi:ROK family transcriptional regulator [Microbacterium sp. 18062]|uniref:ROK family transcriptional regulator n=1 Tax=Microbacterium sp. 18062 TaxID=2681410 RepID=UPI0027D28D14|nr:ROK family transcriptional regulator [Microbacterium sp. 18062]